MKICIYNEDNHSFFRYISGLSFLSSNERITETIKKCLTPLEEPYTYLAICVGIPKEKENFLKLGLTFATKDQEKRVHR